MSNEIKTYQIYDFSVEARSLEEAVKKTKVLLDTNPEKILKE